MTTTTDDHTEMVKLKKKVCREIQEEIAGKIEGILDGISELDPLYYYIKDEAAKAAADLIITRLVR